MSFLKDAIKALDPTPEKTKEITLLLTLLSELCEQKVAQFTERIETDLRTAGTVENRTIPVLEILNKHTEYRAYVKDDAGKIAQTVAGAIKKFIAGTAEGIVDGIAELVTGGLEAIIGAGSGAQQEMSSYFIVVQAYGIMRFDIRAWSRQIEATGITSHIQSALAIVACKSSVAISSLSFNTFLLTYQDQLARTGIDESKWQEYLDTAKKLYEELKKGSSGGNSQQISYTPNTGESLNGVNLVRVPGRLYGSLWEE